MIILDENFPESQRQLLRGWRVLIRQMGYEVGRKGMQDEEIIPFLFAVDLKRNEMARKLNEVERDAMKLSHQERAILAEHLLATLDPGDDVDTEELWLQEAERRYEGYRVGRIASKPAEQVFEDAKQRLQ